MKLPNAGKNSPNQVNVLIEISASYGAVKYEFDKELGLLLVDRFLSTSMIYPCNYGFIPQTLSGDGDPVDVLVYSTHPIIPGALIEVRPLGVLITEDEKGEDAKIIAVPNKKVDPFLSNVESYNDLPKAFISQVEHFFKHYKDLEQEKWVKVHGWKESSYAFTIIKEAIENYKG